MSVRPVQIAQGEERQANIIQHYSTPVEGRGEFKEFTESAKNEEGTMLSMKNHGDYKNDDDAMQIVNKQIRVKDFALAHDVINLEQLCKR